MKLEGVIFDLDGTVADTIPVIVEAFRHVFDEFLGRRFSDGEIGSLFGPSEEGIIRKLVPARWRECLEAYYEAYERIHERVPRPFPRIEEAVSLLRTRGIATGLVTGKSRRSALISLRRFGMGGYFDPIETGSPEGGIKPRLLRAVIERWGFPACRTAYIGDSAGDLAAAREAGVVPLRAAWAPKPESETVEGMAAEETFSSVGEFIEWLKELPPVTATSGAVG